MIPTADQLVDSQAHYKSDDSLADRVLAVLAQGPGTVEELRAEVSHVTAKTLGMTLARLCDAGKAVRLYLGVGKKSGGPRPWIFGLAGVDYAGMSLESRILAALAEGGATTAELAVLIGHIPQSVSSAVAAMRAAGKVRRTGRLPGKSPTGGAQPWIYELGRETAAQPKFKRHGSGHIAGPTYMRQYANWGARW